jgi:hypothetical protein
MALNNGKPAPKFRPNAISLRVNKCLCLATDIQAIRYVWLCGAWNLR